MIVTLAQYPFFISATVTSGTQHDVPLGNVTLDKGYCSRKNGQAVVNDGGTPVIDLKKNVTAKFVGNFFSCQTECIK